MNTNRQRKRGRIWSVSLCAGLVANLLWIPLTAFAGDPQAPDRAVFWKISNSGQDRGYLLGTVHSEDPRVLDFSEAFVEQLSSCEVFAMEMVPDLPTLSRLTEYMNYQDGTTLKDHVGPERYARIESALLGYRVPADWKANMKIWAVMMTLSVPPPQTGFFMDFSLSLRAAGAGLEVTGLESLEQQLRFLEDMPEVQQLQLLDQALDEHDRVAEVHTQMVDAYLTGDLDVLMTLSDEQFQKIDDSLREFFIEQGINVRNRDMVDALLPLLREQRVFVAVGALHLPGDQGLVTLLRNNGYTLSPLDLPFGEPR